MKTILQPRGGSSPFANILGTMAHSEVERTHTKVKTILLSLFLGINGKCNTLTTIRTG